jgi:hypothetical protein
VYKWSVNSFTNPNPVCNDIHVTIFWSAEPVLSFLNELWCPELIHEVSGFLFYVTTGASLFEYEAGQVSECCGDNAGHSLGHEMCASVCHQAQGRVCLWPSLSLIIRRRSDRYGKLCRPGSGNFIAQRVALPLFLHLWCMRFMRTNSRLTSGLRTVWTLKRGSVHSSSSVHIPNRMWGHPSPLPNV